MNAFVDDIKKQFLDGSALIKLMAINIGVFLFVHIFGVVLWLFNVNDGTALLVSWFSLPANITSLLFKPWTIVSYMFLHEALFHIFFNLLVLYFGGQLFLQFLSEKKLVVVYLLGGLAGGLLYIAAFNVFPVFNATVNASLALGASASVIAVLVAAATYVPNFVVRLMLFGDVKLKYIALAYIVIDIVSIPRGNAGGHIAHLGGALFGYWYIVQLKKGKDIGLGFSRFLDRLGGLFSSNKLKVVYQRTGKTRSDEEYNAQKQNNQKAVDAILDKISKSGYDSLTEKEKAILFDASKK